MKKIYTEEQAAVRGGIAKRAKAGTYTVVISLVVLAVLIEDSEYASAVLGNAGMGLLFAALGVYSLLKKAGKAVAGTKVKNLK